MSLRHVASNTLYCLRVGLASLALFQFVIGASLANAAPQQGPANGGNNDERTTSPIKHLIVIIGENRSYDHVFATYVPKPGQFTKNLLSEGIVNADGTPGPNFSKAQQLAATATNPDGSPLDPSQIQWSDPQDGALGTGASITHTFTIPVCVSSSASMMANAAGPNGTSTDSVIISFVSHGC